MAMLSNAVPIKIHYFCIERRKCARPSPLTRACVCLCVRACVRACVHRFASLSSNRVWLQHTHTCNTALDGTSFSTESNVCARRNVEEKLSYRHAPQELEQDASTMTSQEQQQLLEDSYMPSVWSKRYNSQEIIEQFVKVSEEVSQDVRANTECLLDVPYGSTSRTKYDIYGTNLPADAPILVFIHGGYWTELSKDVGAIVVPALVAKGIKVISLGYDLCPNVKFTDIVDQIKAAVQKVLEYAAKSKTRSLWVSGHSAGAHLAASLLHDDAWLRQAADRGYQRILKGFVLLGGIYNLRPLLKVSINQLLKLTEKEIQDYSLPMIDIKHNQLLTNVKVIVTVGEWDSPVFVQESRYYTQKLVTFLDNVEFVFLRTIDHFDILENLRKPDFTLTRLILRNILDSQN